MQQTEEKKEYGKAKTKEAIERLTPKELSQEQRHSAIAKAHELLARK